MDEGEAVDVERKLFWESSDWMVMMETVNSRIGIDLNQEQR